MSFQYFILTLTSCTACPNYTFFFFFQFNSNMQAFAWYKEASYYELWENVQISSYLIECKLAELVTKFFF